MLSVITIIRHTLPSSTPGLLCFLNTHGLFQPLTFVHTHGSPGLTYSTSICRNPTHSPRPNLNATSLMKPRLIPPSRYEHHLFRSSKAYLGALSYDESYFALLKLCVPVFSSLINCELTSSTPTPRQNSLSFIFVSL